MKNSNEIMALRMNNERVFKQHFNATKELMEHLGIKDGQWCFTGSMALYAYGITLPRRIHDVDVLVAPSAASKLRSTHLLKLEPRGYSHSSMVRYSLPKVQIDLAVLGDFDNQTVFFAHGGKTGLVASLEHIIKAKKAFGKALKEPRQKDNEDILNILLAQLEGQEEE